MEDAVNLSEVSIQFIYKVSCVYNVTFVKTGPWLKPFHEIGPKLKPFHEISP